MSGLENLVAAHEKWANKKPTPPGVPVIQVDKIAAKVAAFYERLRSVVGWTEEHLLRKSAIARILRRSIIIKESGEILSEVLLRDLVRGGYFPNNAIPESKIQELEAVLGKYLFLMNGLEGRPSKEARVLREWLFAIAGCEVEAFLDPPIREEALLEFMTDQASRRLVVKDHLSDRDRENLIFISVRQALFKLDQDIITYQLIKKYVPDWNSLKLPADENTLRKFSDDLWRWYESLRMAFRHSYLGKFYWAAEAMDTPYMILGDALSEASKQGPVAPSALSDSEWLDPLLLDQYKKRLKRQKKKAFRAALYSTISIFITKVLLAFAIELPFDKWTGQFKESTLALNILIPPILMIMIVLFGLKRPPKSNAEKVVKEVHKIIEGNPTPHVVKLPTRHSFLIRGFVALLYLLGAAATFGAIIYTLTRLEFSPLSQAIFIFFVSLIVFAGVRIRERSQELVVEERSPGLLNDIFLFFAFPIIELGRWFSRQLLRIRLVALLLDVFIDLPLQFFVEFIEQWRAFLKEKKQEIH